MSVIIPNIETYPVLGYLTDYFDGTPPSYNRYGKVVDTGIKLPREVVFDTVWPNEYGWSEPYNPPLAIVDIDDYRRTESIINQWQNTTDDGTHNYTTIPLPTVYADLIRQSFHVEQGTELLRVVKFPKGSTKEELDAIKSLDPLNLPQNPTSQQRMVLQKYFTRFQRSISLYDTNQGLILPYSFGLIVVGRVSSAITISNAPRTVSDGRVPIPVMPTNPLAQIMMQVQDLMSSIRSNPTDSMLRDAVARLNQFIEMGRVVQGVSVEDRDMMVKNIQGIIDEISKHLVQKTQESTQQQTVPQVIPQSSEPKLDDIIRLALEDITTDSYVFKRLRHGEDWVETVNRDVTSTSWSNRLDGMGRYFTSSAQTNTDYFISVYDGVVTSSFATSQFDVAYGNAYGYGGLHISRGSTASPTKVVYSQLQMLCYGNTSQSFYFDSGSGATSIYSVALNRNQFGEQIDVGNLQLTLSDIATPAIVRTLIDDSGDTDDYYSAMDKTKSVYRIVSGSLSDGVYQGDTSTWGHIYPQLGLLVLDGHKLDASCSFSTNTSENVNGNNAFKLFQSISASATPVGSRTNTYLFESRQSRDENIQTYFVRAKKHEYNYSNNPTWVSGSRNMPLHLDFRTTPTTYITSIGMYNDRGELLAVAKVPQAVKKTEYDDYIFTVRVRIGQ